MTAEKPSLHLLLWPDARGERERELRVVDGEEWKGVGGKRKRKWTKGNKGTTTIKMSVNLQSTSRNVGLLFKHSGNRKLKIVQNTRLVPDRLHDSLWPLSSEMHVELTLRLTC